jgi:hypothetical protein
MPELILCLNFIPEFINIYFIQLSFSIFLTVYRCITFKKYTGTSKFSFRVLVSHHVYLQFILFIIYLTGFSAAKTIQRRMKG